MEEAPVSPASPTAVANDAAKDATVFMKFLKHSRDKLIGCTVERERCMTFAPPNMRLEFEEVLKRDVLQILREVCGYAMKKESQKLSTQSDTADLVDEIDTLRTQVQHMAHSNSELVQGEARCTTEIRQLQSHIAALQGQVARRQLLLNQQREMFLKHVVQRDIERSLKDTSKRNDPEQSEQSATAMQMFQRPEDEEDEPILPPAGDKEKDRAHFERNVQNIKETYDKEKHAAEMRRREEVDELKRVIQKMDASYKQLLASSPPHQTPDDDDQEADSSWARHHPPPVPISVPGSGVDMSVQTEACHLEPTSPSHAPSHPPSDSDSNASAQILATPVDEASISAESESVDADRPSLLTEAAQKEEKQETDVEAVSTASDGDVKEEEEEDDDPDDVATVAAQDAPSSEGKDEEDDEDDDDDDEDDEDEDDDDEKPSPAERRIAVATSPRKTTPKAPPVVIVPQKAAPKPAPKMPRVQRQIPVKPPQKAVKREAPKKPTRRKDEESEEEEGSQVDDKSEVAPSKNDSEDEVITRKVQRVAHQGRSYVQPAADSAAKRRHVAATKAAVRAAEARHQKEIGKLQDELKIKEQVLDQVLRDMDQWRHQMPATGEQKERLDQIKKNSLVGKRGDSPDADDRPETDAPPAPPSPKIKGTANFSVDTQLILDLRRELNQKSKLLHEQQTEIDTLRSNMQSMCGSIGSRMSQVNLSIIDKLKTSVEGAEMAEEMYRISGWTLLAMGLKYDKVLTCAIQGMKQDRSMFQSQASLRKVQRAIELMEYRYAVFMASQRNERLRLKDMSNRSWDRVLFYSRSLVKKGTPQVVSEAAHRSVHGAASRPSTAPQQRAQKQVPPPAPFPVGKEEAVEQTQRKMPNPPSRPATAPSSKHAKEDAETPEQRRDRVLQMLYRDRRQNIEQRIKERQKNAANAIEPVFEDAAKVFRLIGQHTPNAKAATT